MAAPRRPVKLGRRLRKAQASVNVGGRVDFVQANMFLDPAHLNRVTRQTADGEEREREGAQNKPSNPGALSAPLCSAITSGWEARGPFPKKKKKLRERQEGKECLACWEIQEPLFVNGNRKRTRAGTG